MLFSCCCWKKNKKVDNEMLIEIIDYKTNYKERTEHENHTKAWRIYYNFIINIQLPEQDSIRLTSAFSHLLTTPTENIFDPVLEVLR